MKKSFRAIDELARKPDEVLQYRAQRMVRQWAEGIALRDIAAYHGSTVDTVQTVLGKYVHSLWKSQARWKLAEMRCRALSLELRYLRLNQECPEDRPIETLDPSEKSLKAFHRAGVRTVNQLRSVETQTILMTNWAFPRTALTWAILTLDRLGLSHRLKMEKKNASVYPKGDDYLRATGQELITPERRAEIQRLATPALKASIRARKKKIYGT